MIVHPSSGRRRPGWLLPYIYQVLMGLGIVGLLYLGLHIAAQVHAVRTAESNLRVVELASCRATNAARRETNIHLRLPLKEAVTIAAGSVATQTQQEALIARFEVIAADRHDPDAAALARSIVGLLQGNPKLSAAYAKLAGQIETLPPLDCSKSGP